MNAEHLLAELSAIARIAGNEAMEIYATDFAVHDKDDKSPVTEADERVEAVILQRLAALTPDIPIISEEAAAAGHIPDVESRFWLVDPLDGTKEFIKRNGEFTINIALIEQGQPVLGVVYAPALDRLFRGAEGFGAYLEQGGVCRPITCRAVPAAGLTVVGSRSHSDAEAMNRFLAGRTVVEQKSAGSSLKFCLVAAGEADLYPRLGRTMEWDTAAGHAVLLAAGGSVNTLDGSALQYGKPGLDNPHFVAAGAVA
ncbi:MAG: 3'(2'),5'-bisphosphate nucleotidase CysQ [Pseudomonas sp.]